ncbi:MAG: hypothetical protein JXX14_15395 [Deltaproteobacteria bacterium]|nr:hypothetical protein [Deltaproteobacteria bacterium]
MTSYQVKWPVTTCLAFFLILPCRVWASDFYVDPVNGSAAGDGSASNPWLSLQQVLDDNLIESQGWDALPPGDDAMLISKNSGAPVKAGDTLWLQTGDYGAVNLTGYYNHEMVTIQAVAGADARFTSVLVRASANWTIRGLNISQHLVNRMIRRPWLILILTTGRDQCMTS